ncbi:hypothetical protein DL96DRAFT_1623481 [Flagelloscypha sp. PMI_526]|nr:hypothetical protein DL96DRAFT_1623481 [Flagelloscypha sp. PMI_526]
MCPNGQDDEDSPSKNGYDIFSARIWNGMIRRLVLRSCCHDRSPNSHKGEETDDDKNGPSHNPLDSFFSVTVPFQEFLKPSSIPFLEDMVCGVNTGFVPLRWFSVPEEVCQESARIPDLEFEVSLLRALNWSPFLEWELEERDLEERGKKRVGRLGQRKSGSINGQLASADKLGVVERFLQRGN